MSSVKKVLVTRKLLSTGFLDAAAKRLNWNVVTWNQDSNADRDFLLREAKGAAGIICMLTDKIDEELVAAAGPSLKVVSTVSAGFDHITTESLKSRGIRLGTTPDALTDATADIGAMLALLASRRGGEAIRSVVDGKWPTTPWSLETLCGRSIQRSTVGVLGFGRIGQMTLKRLIGFGIKDALYSTSKPGATLSPAKDYYNLVKEQTIPITPAKDLDELAARSDFLIICCSLTPQTKNLIDAKFLAKMSPHSYVINTARGGIVDSQALDAAVRNGVIAGAGLDVVDGEPNVPADHFLVQNQRIVLTPHIGSATIYTRTLMCEEAVTNLAAGLGQGEWVNQVEL